MPSEARVLKFIMCAILGGGASEVAGMHPLWAIKIEKYTEREIKLYRAIVPYALRKPVPLSRFA